MDPGLKDKMLAYYDERASEYEEAYTRGSGTASITDPAVFINEHKELIELCAISGTVQAAEGSEQILIAPLTQYEARGS